jgi:hypothetical protein
MFKRPNRLFNCALLGLVILATCNLILFVALLGRVWQAERDWQARLDELEHNRILWQTQALSSYQVTYSNCGGGVFCCQSETLTVRDDMVAELPTCANNSYGVYNTFSGYWSAYQSVSDVNDTFYWVELWMGENRDLPLEVDYHPTQGYITLIRLTPDDSGPQVVIEYLDLQAQ